MPGPRAAAPLAPQEHSPEKAGHHRGCGDGDLRSDRRFAYFDMYGMLVQLGDAELSPES